MSDQDYIRKAVELADGWEPFNSVAVKCRGDVMWTNLNDEDETAQVTLDALAAQLVRQVVGVDGIEVIVQHGEAALWAFDSMLGSSKGPDRTMNTIKAIVDSGVLDQSDQRE